MLSGRYWFQIQYKKSMSWFSKDIDPIFKSFNIACFWKMLIAYARFSQQIGGASGLFLPAGVFSHISNKNDFWYSEISPSNMSLKFFQVFMNYLESFGGPKVRNNWFGETWARPTIRKPWKWRVFWSSQSEIEQKLVQNKTEWFFGAFGSSFSSNLQ